MKRRKSMRKVIFIIFLVVVIFCIYLYLYEKEQKRQIFLAVEDELFVVNEYYIYGTHFNIKGNISDIESKNLKDIKVVILDSWDKEIEYPVKYRIEDDIIKVETSELINEGIYLDDIDTGNYYCLLKIVYENNNVKYYSMENKTDYPSVEYYTITNNRKNKKVNISFKEFNFEEKTPYLSFKVNKVKLPKNVYDIAIDPGHGGSDPGAVNGRYKESEIVIEYAKDLKKALEDLGLKVILTRDGTEDSSKESKFNVYSVYDTDGRVNIVGRAKAKYNFSLHANSLETDIISGVEIYAPANATLELAQDLADNMVELVKTTYSNREIDKVSDGVYVRTFTEEEIQESNADAKQANYEPYNIKISTPYLYMIRETGGIVTGAYVDGRNKDYGKNEYYNSNIGVESYLIELGYIINKEDLSNMLNHRDLYVKAMTQSIKENIYK